MVERAAEGYHDHLVCVERTSPGLEDPKDWEMVLLGLLGRHLTGRVGGVAVPRLLAMMAGAEMSERLRGDEENK